MSRIVYTSSCFRHTAAPELALEFDARRLRLGGRINNQEENNPGKRVEAMLTIGPFGQHDSVNASLRARRWLVALALLGSVALNGAALWFAIHFASEERDEPESRTMELTFSVTAPKHPVANAKPVPPVPPPPIQPPPQPPKPKSSQPPKEMPKPAAAAPAPSNTPSEVAPTPEPVPVEPNVAPAVENTAPMFPPIPEEAESTTDSAPLFNAAYLHNPKVPYPLEAKRMGIQGTVVLNVVVSPQGKAEMINISTSSGSAILDEAAVAAVRGWRFLPAHRGRQAVTEAVVVPVRFSLDRG